MSPRRLPRPAGWRWPRIAGDLGSLPRRMAGPVGAAGCRKASLRLTGSISMPVDLSDPDANRVTGAVGDTFR